MLQYSYHEGAAHRPFAAHMVAQCLMKAWGAAHDWYTPNKVKIFVERRFLDMDHAGVPGAFKSGLLPFEL